MTPSHAHWTAEEFERLRALNRPLFVGAVHQLGLATREGDVGALESMVRALAVSKADDWTQSVLACESDDPNWSAPDLKVSLADAYGLALTSHFSLLTQKIHETINRLFTGSDGELEFAEVTGSAKYRTTQPLVKLFAYAMHCNQSEKALTAFLKPWSKHIEPTDESCVCIDMSVPGQKKPSVPFQSNMTLHAHAVMSGNTQAIKTLGACFENANEAMFENFSKSVKTYKWSENISPLEIAAEGVCAPVVRTMLEQLRSTCDKPTFLNWASIMLRAQIKGSGLINPTVGNGGDFLDFHDKRIDVFQSIMEVGGQEFLDSHDERIHLLVTKSTRDSSQKDREVAAEARKMVLRAEGIAAESIKKSHPEGIRACAALLWKTKHFTENESSLDHPLLSIGLNTTTITRAMAERILGSFDPKFMQEQLSRDGLALLHESAKVGNLALATALVDLGVDPVGKDDRGWKAESHFKDKEKQQWRAFLSSRNALGAINSIFANLPRSVSTASSGGLS